MSDWKRRIATPLLFLASLAGSLALAELVLLVAKLTPSYDAPKKEKHLELAEPEAPHLRVGWANARFATKTFRYDDDPRGYFGPGGAVTHTTNSLGYRGPEFSRLEADGVMRIAALTASLQPAAGMDEVRGDE